MLEAGVIIYNIYITWKGFLLIQSSMYFQIWQKGLEKTVPIVLLNTEYSPLSLTPTFHQCMSVIKNTVISDMGVARTE